MAGPTVLITSRTPRLDSGTGLRTYGVVAALSRTGPVEVRYVPFAGDAVAAQYRSLTGVTLAELAPSRGVARGVAFGRALATGVPPGIARGVSAELSRAADGVAPGTRVVADGPVVAAALRGASRRRAIAYLAHNLESAGFRGTGGAGRLRRFERAVLRACAEAWMPTHADERGARALAGDGLHTRYVPNVVDVAAIEPLAPARDRRAVFVADLAYAPNREALGFLLERVMPLAWRADPELRLRVVGRGAESLSEDPRVESRGFVQSLRDDGYAGCTVALVPLLSGGGSPLKFIEGLAYGLPVVATDHAAALLEQGEPGRDFLATSDPERFADAIVGLAGDPLRAEQLAAAGRRLALDQYSIDALGKILGAMTAQSGARSSSS